MNPLFSRPFFSVCILFEFVCIVSILIYIIYRYMSHTLELLCACMCMYCMYVHVFSVCISSRYASQIFLEENMSKALPPPKSRQINFRRLVNVCMCLYCMYVYILYVCACIFQNALRQSDSLGGKHV